MIFGLVLFAGVSLAEPTQEDSAAGALKEIQDLVGEWEGTGKSDASEGWEEKISGRWKFGAGKSSLYFHLADVKNSGEGRLLDEFMIAFDPAKETYVLKAYAKGASDEPLAFSGKARSPSHLVFDRDRKGGATDPVDRIELKLLNDGDRLVYTVQRRIGASSRYRPYALVGLNRKGTSLAAKASGGPTCVVTGGAGVIAVSHDGKTYFVCCSGCRDAFLADPAKYLARREKR